MSRVHCFHEVKIGPILFRGTITIDGPTIEAWIGKKFEGSVALGVCSIACAEAWYVVKYLNERRICLAPLSNSERETLMQEFGIGPLEPHINILGRKKLGLDDPFFSSPAFGGLCTWVRHHPGIAEKYAESQQYLRDWHGRALVSSHRAPLRVIKI